MRKIDYLTFIWFGVMTLIAAFFRYESLAIEYVPIFIEGVTTVVGIIVAVTVFLLASILRDYSKEITRFRTSLYLAGTFSSLGLAMVSYLQMIGGEIQNSIIVVNIAFVTVLTVLANLILVYYQIIYSNNKQVDGILS